MLPTITMDKGRLIRKTPVVCDGMNKIFTLAAAFATAIATAFFGIKYVGKRNT